MKRSVFYILTVWVLCLVTGCRHTASYPPAMQQAESLMNARPDSAWQLLQAMEDTVPLLPEEARMYWHLLTIQAKDKLYITHTDDSLINRIVQYYEASEDKDRLMMAYFYQGSTYRDMNDAPRALKAYHQAIDAGEGTKNLTLMGQTYGQLGTLFVSQHLYDEALEAKRKSLHYYMQRNDSVRYPYLIRDLARIHSAKGYIDSAVYYYKEALSLASSMNKRQQAIGISGELGCYYYEVNIKDKAKIHLLEAANHSLNSYNVFLFLGHVYNDENCPDSARYYWLKASDNSDIFKQRSSYLYLSELENSSGNKKLSKFYQTRYLELNDSINSIIQTDTIVKNHLTYKYEKVKNENKKLADKATLFYYLFLIIIFFLLLYIGCLAVFKKKKCMNDKPKDSSFTESDIYAFVLKASRDEAKMTAYEWEKLETAIDTSYPTFKKRLFAIYPKLSLHELRICWLVKANLSNRNIAKILNSTDSAISYARKRLYKKMSGNDGTGEDFNKLIADL